MSAFPLPIAALAAASHVAPALVAPFFRRMMLNPRRHVRPPPVLSLPPADQRIDLGDGLVAWRWGEGPVVLLVHGFEGNRAQFAAIVSALVERGFAPVALDVPAHGESAGHELTAVKFIAAIERTLARLAPVHAVIGHSLGAAMSLYSVAHTGGANRVALISAPSSLKRELNRFAAAVGLSERGAAAFIARSKPMSAGRRRTSTSAASPARSTCRCSWSTTRTTGRFPSSNRPEMPTRCRAPS